jgi:hypothetical protein
MALVVFAALLLGLCAVSAQTVADNESGRSGCGHSAIIVPLHADNNNGSTFATPRPSRYYEVNLTDAAHGVWFDLNGDGAPEQIAWIADDAAAFLAMDRDGDGAITSGKELFGDSTEGSLAPNGVRYGFWALSILKPGVGRLYATDPAFAKLLLWTDVNHNGVSDPGEVQPSSNVLSAIALNAELIGRKDQHGNRFEWQGGAFYNDKPDVRRPIYDVRFVTAPN